MRFGIRCWSVEPIPVGELSRDRQKMRSDGILVRIRAEVLDLRRLLVEL